MILPKRMPALLSRNFTESFCFPVGVVPKKSLGEVRLIHHLSFPRGQSINAHTGCEHCKLLSSVCHNDCRNPQYYYPLSKNQTYYNGPPIVCHKDLFFSNVQFPEKNG